jgi:hypothetical protein
MKRITNSTLKLIIGLEVVLILLVVVGLIAAFFYFRQVSAPAPGLEPTPTFAVTPTVFFTPEIMFTETSAGSSRAQIPVKDFSLSVANTNAPEDILEEVEYYGGGGGLYVPCQIAQNKTETLYIDKIDIFYVGLPFKVVACGWQENEIVTVTWIRPDEIWQEKIEIAKYEVEADTSNFLPFVQLFDYAPVNVPSGEYTFQFSGTSGTLEGSFFVPEADSAQFLWITPENGVEFILYNFQPEEEVRLFVYERKKQKDWTIAWAQLIGWQAYRLDSSGRLIISILDFDEDNFYAVVGEQSGQVFMQDVRLETWGMAGCSLAPNIRKTDEP